MNKYDMMIACNRKTSEEKINRTVTEGQDCDEDSSNTFEVRLNNEL